MLALAVAALLAGHRLFPDVAGTATLLESMLPWVGLAIPPLGLLALLTRSKAALLTLVVPGTVWAILFLPLMVPKHAPAGTDLTVASQNINSVDNPDPCAAARALAQGGTSVIAVQELGSDRCVPQVLAVDHPYSVQVGTVGLWSTFPLRHSKPLKLGLTWSRALRAELQTPRGVVTIYAVHLPSIRPGQVSERNQGLRALAELTDTDKAYPVLILGDFNTATTDRALGSLTGLHEAHLGAGRGFGFTWPATLPVTRPDHILYRTMTPVSSRTLAANGSDHLGITASFRI
ncbi:endonuclease/exonuclease/phosphatase family protein [Krasilnikovia sp. M28-CT-15]|uniref:endonuclease/exonuclease/phosphatase family protein n=1 Tax=Krasilnikovia sp. M28-CT-15 TaxID=3373540 RepID=UPI00399CC2D3